MTARKIITKTNTIHEDKWDNKRMGSFTLHCAYQLVTSEAKPNNHLITAYVMEMKMWETEVASQTWLVIYTHFDTSTPKKYIVGKY